VRHRLTLVLATALAGAVVSPAAQAAGGHYTFDGGTAAQRNQVTLALDASSFDWNVVPGVVTIHIVRAVSTEAAPGQIWIDANLLDAGRFAWGVVQHEYAHEVDFLVLTPRMRARLSAELGGLSWWANGSAPHGALSSERFADEVAWSYWTTGDNCMEPLDANDEGGQLPPRAFRTLLGAVLAGGRDLAAVKPRHRIRRLSHRITPFEGVPF
jgi:hypothetical protein